MFSIGDSFIYGGNCICKLTGLQDKCVNYETHPYYILKPVFETGATVYVPVGNKKLEEKMRRLLSVKEVYHLIDEMPEKDAVWVENENQRQEQYRQVLSSGNRIELIRRIKAVVFHQKEMKSNGKKLRIFDERFMKDAEKALYDEFAYVLGMKHEEVLSLICSRIERAVQPEDIGSIVDPA